MPIHPVFTGQSQLHDLEMACGLGQRLWEEDDLQFDLGAFKISWWCRRNHKGLPLHHQPILNTPV